MTRKIKQLWIAALRSKRYHQGQNYLEHNGKYCCLGVLCAVTKRNQSYTTVHRLIGSELEPCVSILMRMNDQDHNSFQQIANYIQRYM